MAHQRSVASIYRGSQSYTFPTDTRGRPTLPTLAAVERIHDPLDKLAIASQLADVIHIQAETAVQAGSIGRLADLVFRSGQMLDALGDVVDGLTDAAEPATATAAIKRHQRPLAGVLATLHETLRQIATMMPATDGTVAARTALRLRQIDIQAGTLAGKAGLVWRQLPVTGPGIGIPVSSIAADRFDVVA